MSDKPLRDTQFMGFAKLLLDELPEQPYDDSVLGIAYGDWKETVMKIIAQRAYDLVSHVIDHAPASVSDADDWNIPDLTE